MSYAAQHARALATLKRKGVAVTFTKSTRTPVGSAGASTITEAAVAGYAIRIKGDPKFYEALKLVGVEVVSLEFAAETYGDAPALGATVDWASNEFSVKSVEPLAPDGVPIVSRVVASR